MVYLRGERSSLDSFPSGVSLPEMLSKGDLVFSSCSSFCTKIGLPSILLTDFSLTGARSTAVSFSWAGGILMSYQHGSPRTRKMSVVKRPYFILSWLAQWLPSRRDTHAEHEIDMRRFGANLDIELFTIGKAEGIIWIYN